MTKRVRQGVLALMIGVLLGLLAALLLVRARMGSAPAGPAASLAPGGTEAVSVPTAPPMPAGTPVPAAAEPSQTPVSPEPDRNEAVAELFRRFAGEHPGRWNLCFLALPDGEPVIWGSEEGPMVSASLIKLPIMGAVYEAVAAGSLDPAQCENWLGPMITVSDNGSANSLVLLLGGGDADKGMAAVNDWCLRQGLTDTRQNRLMLVDNGLQNYTGAADCARLLAAIYRGDCVSHRPQDRRSDRPVLGGRGHRLQPRRGLCALRDLRRAGLRAGSQERDRRPLPGSLRADEPGDVNSKL